MDASKLPTDTNISAKRLMQLHHHWQAANYLAVAQLYLKNNVLLQQPLEQHHLKPRLLGHWGTVPGLNLVYTHLNRLILDTDANMLLITGPGHGAPAIVANLYLEGSLGAFIPEMDQSRSGIEQTIRSFSWPYGLPSHLFAGTPGQVHEGGELGYSLSHAFGAAFDNPNLIVTCIVGDGEAETGPLATAWHSNKFLNPVSDGAVLPILHLNGYKISGPTLLARMSHESLTQLFNGYGYQVRIVEGDDPTQVHPAMWQAMDWAYQEISNIQRKARKENVGEMPAWPMIVMQTPKGWTGPKQVDGEAVENNFKSHQIPVEDFKEHPDHLQILEEWLRSYQPHTLFDEQGKPSDDVAALCPKGERRMGMNPHTNGGAVLTPLQLPDYSSFGLDVPEPGATMGKGTEALGNYLKEIFVANEEAQNFRLFCPDELSSNKLQKVLDVTNRAWQEPVIDNDQHLARNGRVMEVLSEHNCEGWLEGYLLTGRHGLFACYEAFIPIVDSMFNQYAKWLKVSKETSWRKPIASLNYLLTSHVWRQDHNGYSHQVPSFMNNMLTKKNSVTRIYLPPDANSLLAVTDHCLRSRDLVNLIVANKAAQRQWLNMEVAQQHCKVGAGIWEWAGNTQQDETPDIILAAAGDVPTTETVRAAQLIMGKAPAIKVRMVNVVDLFALMSHEDHSHGLDKDTFSKMFTENQHVVFAFHGYPNLIHELLHHRPEPERFHVRGYIEEGSTTTPFDMLVLNKLSRFHLVLLALKYIEPSDAAKELTAYCQQRLDEHHAYIRAHGQDMQEILKDMQS